MAKRAQQESGEGRVTAKSRPMMNLTARTPSFGLLQPHQTRGGPRMDIKILENLFQVTIERWKLVEPSRSDYLQKDYGRSWSSQEWKSGAAERDWSGKPEENSWDSLQKVDPHREEPLLGRNAHSARYGELTIHDRTVKPVSVHCQEQAYFENFVMGQWRSRICEQSQRPSATSTEKNVEHCRVM